MKAGMEGFVERLREHPSLGSMVAHYQRVPGRPAAFATPEQPLPQRLTEALGSCGIGELYEHQALAVDAAREERNVLAVTPTASGKTLVFALPVLEAILKEPGARGLFLYPTKALARDQVHALNDLALGLGALRPPRFEIYDGDTTATQRKRIKADPPDVLVTNPDMLHLGILAHHGEWEAFLRDLRFVVLDELHVYRGIFGAHVHHTLQRLRRRCAALGSHPRFIAASATVGNPAEFAETLVGEPFTVLDRSGAPAAPRHVMFLNPVGVSPYTVAVRLVAECAAAGLKTIAFAKARRITELLHTWLVRQQPELAQRVAPYRAGYLPQERRDIETRLFNGELTAVLSTSALELGIDVGALDVCVLVGYPGSLISSWQRIGRVGRQDRDALVVMIAMPDALDQYLVHHPEMFFGDGYERAVLDPWNPYVAGHHLVCAATEEPLRRDELERADPRAGETVDALTAQGRLRQDASGDRWYSFRRRPHRGVSLRSAAEPFSIVDSRSGKLLGNIDGIRVYHECHPGAIYLHGGQTYRILRLDKERRSVTAEASRVDYYTVVLGEKETEILEVLDRAELRRDGPGEHDAFPIGLGRLKVTVHIREYQKRRLFGGEPISTHPVDAPPLIFETVGFWIELPPGMPAEFASRDLHFMGGIHATEHAMIGLFPLLAIADRGDVGGISYTGHPQLGAPAIFVYDGHAGGAGLAERGFRDLRDLLRRTHELVLECPCDSGCPGCIQSPKCGNGNKPLDKEAALRVMRILLGHEKVELHEVAVADSLPAGGVAAVRPAPAARPARRQGIVRAGNVEPGAAPPPAPVPAPEPSPAPTPALAERLLVFDLETQRSAAEVGGWGRSFRMGLALAIVYDVARDTWTTYHESDVHRLMLDLVMADRVVGFNINRFDLEVLSGYTEWDLGRVRTCDLLEEIRRPLGYRLSLNHLAEVNLGESKSADGLQSLRWWREGRVDLIESYCKKDVEVTHRLFRLGREQGYLLYRDREQRTLRVPVSW
jgi:DEAD/DEAH box helicase domain-containing protein